MQSIGRSLTVTVQHQVGVQDREFGVYSIEMSLYDISIWGMGLDLIRCKHWCETEQYYSYTSNQTHAC